MPPRNSTSTDKTSRDAIQFACSLLRQLLDSAGTKKNVVYNTCQQDTFFLIMVKELLID